MNSKKRILWVNALIIFPLLLTACGPASTPSPTVDVNALYTQAAVTIIAQLTANAPTITPTTASTNTPMPSMTPLGGALPTLPPLATLPSLSTPTTAASNAPDKAAYITQSPSDYSSVTTGKVFNIIWRLRNVGTTTWTPNYVYRFYSASNKISTSANGYNLPATVPPNGEVELKAVATASGTPGTYDTRWVITNADGVNFASFDLTINVVQGTSSNVVSATSTGAPNACSDVNHAFGGGYANVNAANPLTADSVQGGQIYISWSPVTKGTGTFVVQLDGVTPDGMNGIAVNNTGAKWLGEPDTATHEVTVTVTGDGEIKVKLYSINSDQWCH